MPIRISSIDKVSALCITLLISIRVMLLAVLVDERYVYIPYIITNYATIPGTATHRMVGLWDVPTLLTLISLLLYISSEKVLEKYKKS